MNSQVRDPLLDDDIEDNIQDAEGDDDIEARARAQGWRPEEEWDEERAVREKRKKPSRFFTAKEFLDRTADNLPILNERLRKLEEENRKLSVNQREMTSLIDDQRKQHREALVRVREEERKKAEEKLQTAAAEGDLDAHKEALAEIKVIEKRERDELLQETKTQPGQQEDGNPHNKADPQMLGWVDRNAWFQDKERAFLNVYMISQHKKIVQGNPDLPVLDALERAKRMVMNKFPEEFGGTAETRRGSPNIDGGNLNNSRGGPSNKSVEERFAALPAEARTAYERTRLRMEKMSPPAKFTKQEYLEEYGA